MPQRLLDAGACGMSAENKGKWGALAAALVLLLGGGTGGFFLGKAQTLKQQQQVIDVQDCTTIYATISQISGGKVRADGLEVNDSNGRGSFSFTLSEDTPITWHHTKIALSACKKGTTLRSPTPATQRKPLRCSWNR